MSLTIMPLTPCNPVQDTSQDGLIILSVMSVTLIIDLFLPICTASCNKNVATSSQPDVSVQLRQTADLQFTECP